MMNATAERIAPFKTISEMRSHGWKALRAFVVGLLTDPTPLVDDLPWWAPQRRRAGAITVAVIALLISGITVYIRHLDATYDSPSKFEQIYYLNNSFSFSKDDVTISLNLFGISPDTLLKTHAELRRMRGKTGNIGIEDLNAKYLKFSLTTIRPGKTAIGISALPGERNLQAALQKLADLGLIRFTSAANGTGPVYSFDLEMEVVHGPYSLQTFTETIHLRADTMVEHSAFGLAVFLTILAILLVADFTHAVLDWRWRKYFKAMASALTEVLHYLTYVIKIAEKLPEAPAILNDDLVNLLKDIIEQLEKTIALHDDKEAQALREEALVLHKRVIAHAALPLKTEAELSEWKISLKEIITRTEQLRQRTLHLSKRRLRYFKEPVTWKSLCQAMDQTNQTLSSGFNRLKVIIGKINVRRSEKRKTHEKDKSHRISKIAHFLDDYLDGQVIKQAMEKLGEPFPLSVEPEELFGIRPIYAHGENEYIDGKLLLVYRNFHFAVKASDDQSDDPIWFKIERTDDDFVVEQAVPDPKLKLGTTTLPAQNPRDEEANIQYTVKVTPEISTASRRNRDFKIKTSDVTLIQPCPDPEEWFKEEPLPGEPKEVKLD